MRGLSEWLSQTFGGTFTVEKAGSFESRQQKDNISCGLFAINAIRHEVLKEPLLSQEKANTERVRWFNALCQMAHDAVRKSISHLMTAETNSSTGESGRYRTARTS